MAEELSQEQQIVREVQRRVASQTRRHHDESTELRSIIRECRNKLTAQHNVIKGLTADPLTFGNLIKVHPYPDPSLFKQHDEVFVIAEGSDHRYKGGRIMSRPDNAPIVDGDGKVLIKLNDDQEAEFSIGLEGKGPVEAQLSQKEDGTFSVVQIDGKNWEVKGLPDYSLRVGDTVKVIDKTKAVVAKADHLTSGPICKVAAVSDQGVEVWNKGEKSLVYNPQEFELEEGDRVACDPNMFCIREKLERDARDRYKVKGEINVGWDDIGGLEIPKQDFRDALELPFQNPELFEYYSIDPLRGILLYGPPGCGKTLLARAAVAAMAGVHGKEVVESAYIFVKGPEILDKWVGNTEAEIRELFERGRRHYRTHGYKGILAIDEADAILPQRGTRRSSDIADTIVPMFLGEMDGIDSEQTKENPIVILMTNRADILDPAVTRPGRISKHIKVERPDSDSAIDILSIHAKMPFANEANKDATLAIVSSDIFSKSRLLYRVNNEHDFTFGDAINGAALANITEVAKMNALHRDLDEGTRSGVTIDDFRDAVNKVYYQQKSGINHAYDIEDFCHKHGLHADKVQVERCFGGM